MDYGEFKTAFQTRADVTVSVDSFLPQLMNEGLQKISTSGWFEWWAKRDTIATAAPVTTGTATVTNNSATVTLNTGGTATDAMVGQLFKGPDESMYVITARSSNTITLSSVYLGTTSATAAYTVYFWQVTLPTDMAQAGLKQLVHQNPYEVLMAVSEDEWTKRYPQYYSDTGNPDRFFLVGDRLAQLFPIPSTEEGLLVVYYRTPTLYSLASAPATSATIDLPAEYHDALLFYCLAQYSVGRSKSQGPIWMKFWQDALQLIVQRHNFKIARDYQARAWRPRSSVRRSRIVGTL